MVSSFPSHSCLCSPPRCAFSDSKRNKQRKGFLWSLPRPHHVWVQVLSHSSFRLRGKNLCWHRREICMPDEIFVCFLYLRLFFFCRKQTHLQHWWNSSWLSEPEKNFSCLKLTLSLWSRTCRPTSEPSHTKWSELCCALVPQPQTHWLVCAQPLFLSVNTPLDQSTSSSSSSSFRGPDLVAKRQSLGRTPTCYHNGTLTHAEVLCASSQIQQQILKLAWLPNKDVCFSLSS